MRILLDAHVSGRRVGAALRADGHDVIALDESTDLGSLADTEVLALAAADRRILITFDARHFAPLLRRWAEAGHSHSGCIIVYGLDHSEFGLILRGIRRLLGERPQQEEWVDLADAIPASGHRLDDALAANSLPLRAAPGARIALDPPTPEA